MATGDVVNTALAPPVRRTGGRDPRRRDDVPGDVDGDRVPRRRACARQGEVRAGPRLGGGRAANRLGVDIAFRGGAELIGREQELRLLRDALARSERERAPQLVTLVGAPGIGKSRLLFELYAALDDDPEVFANWRQGRSLPYGEGVSFWALGEMVKAQAGILESDSSDEAAAKLGTAVTTVVHDEVEAQWVDEHLGPLVGLEGPEAAGGDLRREAFAAWRRFFESLAETRPLVLVFEDIHWADEGLLDFIDHLVDWATDVPILVVCTARPELLERRPGWGGGKRSALTVSLSPLSDSDIERLLRALLAERLRAAGARRGPAGARGRQPALRGGVRPHAGGDRHRRRPAASRDGAGHHRRAPRHARGRGEGARPGRGRRGEDLLGRRPRCGQRPSDFGGRAGSPAARAHGVRAARAPLLGRRRDGLRLPPRSRARRRLRADPAAAPRRAAPPHRRVARVAGRRPGRGHRRPDRAPLSERAPVRPRRRTGPRRPPRAGPASRSPRPATARSRSPPTRRRCASTARRSTPGPRTIPSGRRCSCATARRSSAPSRPAPRCSSKRRTSCSPPARWSSRPRPRCSSATC